MCFFVLLQMGLGAKPVCAFLALMGFFTGMKPFMSLKIRFRGKTFPANRAHMSCGEPIIEMCLFMSTQIALESKTSIA